VPEGGQARGQMAVHWAAPLLLTVIFAGLVMIRLDRCGFFDNEGRYAEVAREMLQRRDLVTPEMDGTLFLNKPPLMFWLTAAAFTLGAPAEWARIVSVVAAALSVLLTCWLAFRLWDFPTGLLAGAFLATSFGFVLEARTLRPDSVLIASILTALCSWHVAEAAPERRRAAWLMLGYAALGVGFMTKGAVPIALVAVPVVACTVRDHGWQGLGRLRPLLGVAVFLAVAAPWHVMAAWRHAGFAWDYVINQHLLFFLDKKLPRDSEGDALATFWLVFLGRSLPWVVLVPFTLDEAVRGSRRGAPAATRATFFAWAWMAGVMLIFSASPSRLEHYSLPALPAAALLAARGWRRVWGGEVGAAGWAWLGAVAVVLVVTGTVGAWRGRMLLERVYWIREVPSFAALVLPAAAASLLGGLLLGASVVQRRAVGILAGLGAVGIPLIVIVLQAQAAMEPIFSWKPLAGAIEMQVPASVDVVFEAPTEYQQVGGLAFYTGRHITLLEPENGFTPPTYLETYRDTMFLPRDEFARRWNGPDPVAFVSDPQRRRDTADGLVPGPFHVLARSGDRWLLGNRLLGHDSAD
jgi:4-amino-4-deoxy-L-arabinose transferase-like glycosyltransferase